jgi:putative phosphoribosyl transferase
LQKVGIATLLLDLLSLEEETDRSAVFDVKLLAQRLIVATEWIAENEGTKKLRAGYFGASTGAAAALLAAAKLGKEIFAVVSRGGRPDLALQYIQSVESPTLLIVGEEDKMVIPLNESALREMRCEKELIVIPGASHMFEERGKLEEVARIAREWFLKHLASV